jgi:hypothetical protein
MWSIGLKVTCSGGHGAGAGGADGGGIEGGGGGDGGGGDGGQNICDMHPHVPPDSPKHSLAQRMEPSDDRPLIQQLSVVG